MAGSATPALSQGNADIASAIEHWDGEQVVCRFDRQSGAWMFICLHSTARGPAAGGTRLRVYARVEEALHDCMRLASGMTRKMALADLPLGGGKAVIAAQRVPDGAPRIALFARHGEMVNTL